MISLVTGSEGFIGSRLVQRLEQLEHEVISLNYRKIKETKIEKADWVWFLSAYGNHSQQQDTPMTYQANMTDLFSLLENTKHLNYKGFFHFSTSSVDLDYQTTYSATKYAAEVLSQRMAQVYNKPIYSIRPYSVYGEGEADFRFIPTVIRRMKNNEIIDYCHGMHDWVYIHDFIEALICTMDNVHRIEHPVHIGTGIQTDNLGVIDILTKIINPKQRRLHKLEKMRDYDSTRWVCEDRQLMDFGWEPEFTLKEGLEMVVRLYDAYYES